MAKKISGLSKEGREELALAIILWKDFKAGGKLDFEITKQTLEFVDYLGIGDEYDALVTIIPPMKIEPRYP